VLETLIISKDFHLRPCVQFRLLPLITDGIVATVVGERQRCEKLVKTIFSRLTWVGRARIFTVSLAVVNVLIIFLVGCGSLEVGAVALQRAPSTPENTSPPDTTPSTDKALTKTTPSTTKAPATTRGNVINGKIAYEDADYHGRYYDKDIYVMNADGSEQTNLSNNVDGNDSVPVWSPDAKALESLVASGEAARSQNGDVRVQHQEGLPLGAEAPSFSLSGLYGETLTLDALRAPGKPVMLLFSDPNCGPCNALLPEIGRWQQEHAQKLTILLVSRGTPEENRTKSQEHGLTQVLLQKDWEVSEAYEARGTPSAVFVRPDGTIGSPVAAGAEAIMELVAQAAEAPNRVPLLRGAPDPTAAPNGNGGPCPKCGKVHHNGNGAAPAMPAGPKVGEPAPEIKLEDLGGKTVELKDFRGSQALVLFWNPGCGFCQQMLPDLKEWEANPPEEVPKLLLVSAGSEEANQEMGLSSPVVLDQGFSVGRSFGASGTPSAVLVDEEGKVASEVAVGAPAVVERAKAKQTEA
jgi:peroxiredoxin